MVEKTDDTLRSLHERGRVAAEYPRVRGLVRGAGVAETRWAGNLLARIGADAVLAEHPGTPVVSVAFTGHSTVSGLVAPVTAELARHGLLLRPHVSDFDGYVFDLSDTASELYSASRTRSCACWTPPWSSTRCLCPGSRRTCAGSSTRS
ncbi:hypothetical protein ACFWXA_22510 [Streptomyces atroolivaceus]|uniref:hypothetical protein n=1 Tax=Streptomyces atroolivaceus TaxID=66869 RepID=UPI00365B5164